MDTNRDLQKRVLSRILITLLVVVVGFSAIGCGGQVKKEIKVDIVQDGKVSGTDAGNGNSNSPGSDNSNNLGTSPSSNSNEYAEPSFPKAEKTNQWLMFGYAPNNMANVDADIKLPLGKTADDKNPEKSEYRMVSFRAPQENKLYGNPVVFGDNIYFGCHIGYIQCMDFKTSSPVWRNEEPIAPIITPLATDGNVVVAGTSEGILYAYDIKTQKEKWTFKTGKNISAPPGSTDAGMTSGRIHGGPKIVDRKVYFGAYDGKMYCVEASTGLLIWEFAAKSKIFSSPAIYEGKLYFSNFEGKVFCIEQSNGKLVWEAKLEKPTVASPVVFGRRLWIGDRKGKMYCLSTVDGKQIWSYQGPDSDYGIEATPALDENNLYFGDSSGSMTALNRLNGAKIWSVKINKSDVKPNPAINASPVLVRDKVITASHSGRAFIIEKYSGKVLDQFDCRGSVLAQPVVIGNEILITSYDSTIYILRQKGSKDPYK
jgi:outer membrane protein assembly factor BamB